MNKRLKTQLLLATGALVGIATTTGLDQPNVNADEKVATTPTANAGAATTDQPTASDTNTATDQTTFQSPAPVESSTDPSAPQAYGNAEATDTSTDTGATTAPAATTQPTETSQPTSSTTTTPTETTQPATGQTTGTAPQRTGSATSGQVDQGTQTTQEAPAQQSPQSPVQESTPTSTSQSTPATTTDSTQSDTATVKQSKQPQQSSKIDSKKSPVKDSNDPSSKKEIEQSEKATPKIEYITYDEATGKNDEKRIFYRTTALNPVTKESIVQYFKYVLADPNDPQSKNHFEPITDQSDLDHIENADKKEVVDKTYLKDKEALEIAVGQKLDNVDEHKIVYNSKTPPTDNNAAVIAKQYFKITDNQSGAEPVYVVQLTDGNETHYYKYNGEIFDKTANVDDDVAAAINADALAIDYAPEELIESLKEEVEDNKEIPETWGNYEVMTSDGEPNSLNKAQYFPYIIDGKTVYFHPDNSDDYDGGIETIFVDNTGNLWKIHTDDESQDKTLIKLNETETTEFNTNVPDKFRQTTYLENSEGTPSNVELTPEQQAIKEALGKEIGVDQTRFVQIGDELYIVKKDGTSLPANTAVYTLVKPLIKPKTTIPDPTKSLEQVTEVTNPGINITLTDYTVTGTSDGDNGVGKDGLADREVRNAGINKDKKLKFSDGGSIKSGVAAYNKSNPNGYPKIVAPELSNGYPTVDGESLAYLFNGSSTTGSSNNYVTNQPLKMFISDGHGGYSFDSSKYHTVFDDQAGDPSNLGDMLVYNKANKASDGSGGQFFPLDKGFKFFNGNNAQGYNLKGNNAPNHFFGMKMEFSYIHPKGGMVDDGDSLTDKKIPMVFNFSGDDDFWLFIDGKLVLDIGGIHSKLAGSINFKDGKVSVNGKATQSLPSLLGADWDQADKSHEIKIFYLERGHGHSKLQMSFNLQIPEDYHAEKTSYGVETTPDKTEYVYGMHENYAKTDSPLYTYAENERFGIRTTEDETTPPGPGGPETPGPGPSTPDPDPTPDPEVTPPTPEAPTPETPTPETPTTPEDDIELPQALPSDDKKGNDKKKTSSSNKTGKKDGVLYLKSNPGSGANGSGSTGTGLQALNAKGGSTFKYTSNDAVKPASASTNATQKDQELKTASMLPQTGDTHTANWLAVLGLSMLGLLGLVKFRRRRD